MYLSFKECKVFISSFPLNRKGEEKFVYFRFEQLGSHTCIRVDWDDGVVSAHGDEHFCSEWAPDAEYVPGADMTNRVEIPHTF